MVIIESTAREVLTHKLNSTRIPTSRVLLSHLGSSPLNLKCAGSELLFGFVVTKLAVKIKQFNIVHPVSHGCQS